MRHVGAYAVLLCVILLVAGNGVAGEFRLVPSLTTRQEYNDNIFFGIRGDTVHGFITTLSPGLELVSKTERVDLSLLTRIDQRLYWEHPDLNATDQTYQGNLGYAISPKFRVSGRAAYIQDSWPGRDITTTGLVPVPVTRDRQVYGASGEYTFSEKTKATLAYDYNKDHYRSLNFYNMESNVASLEFIHDLSYLTTATKVRSNLGFARYNFTGVQIDSFSGTVGFSRELSELWSVSADAGLRYSLSRTDVVTLQFLPPFTFIPTSRTEKGQDTGWIGKIALTYKGETTNADLTFSHDLFPASGYVGAAERTTVSFNISRRLTYELSGTFSASYFLNKADRGQFSALTINQDVWLISPGLRYEATRDVAVEASYSYTRLQYRNTNALADRNLFMVRLILQHAFLE